MKSSARSILLLARFSFSPDGQLTSLLHWLPHHIPAQLAVISFHLPNPPLFHSVKNSIYSNPHNADPRSAMAPEHITRTLHEILRPTCVSNHDQQVTVNFFKNQDNCVLINRNHLFIIFGPMIMIRN